MKGCHGQGETGRKGRREGRRKGGREREAIQDQGKGMHLGWKSRAI